MFGPTRNECAEGGDADGDPSLAEGVVDAGREAALPLGDRAHCGRCEPGVEEPGTEPPAVTRPGSCAGDRTARREWCRSE